MVAWRTEGAVESREREMFLDDEEEERGEHDGLSGAAASTRAHPIVKANAFTAASDAGAAEQDGGALHFVSFVGRRVVVEAVAHALLTGKARTMVYPDPQRLGISGFEVYAPPTWAWRLPRRRLQTGDTHLVLRPARTDVQRVREPAFTILQPPDGAARVGHVHYLFLSQAVATPLDPLWEDWLWTRALVRGEATPLRVWGDLPAAWTCHPDEDRLRADIRAALTGTGVLGPLPVARRVEPCPSEEERRPAGTALIMSAGNRKASVKGEGA